MQTTPQDPMSIHLSAISVWRMNAIADRIQKVEDTRTMAAELSRRMCRMTERQKIVAIERKIDLMYYARITLMREIDGHHEWISAMCAP